MTVTHRLELVIIATICILLVFCEWLFASDNVLGGVFLALLTTISAYTLASLDRVRADATEALDVLALIPLFILLAAAWPGILMDETLLIPTLYLLLTAIVLRHITIKGLALNTVGLTLHAWPAGAALGLGLGLAAGTLGALMIPVAPYPKAFSWSPFIHGLFLLTCLVAPVEELLFRGLIQRSLIPVLGLPGGLVLTAVLFTVTHQPWPSIAVAAFTLALGLLLGVVYQRTGSLLAPILIHGVSQTITFTGIIYLFPD